MIFTKKFERLSFLGGRAAFAVFCVTGAASAQDAHNHLHPYEEAQGFELMFDGTTAASFRDRFVDYRQNSTTNTALNASWTLSTTLTDPDRPGVPFGAIVMTNPNIVDIRSKKLYRDFDWRFEYRNNGNQGVFYRFDVSGGYAWHTGIEYAIDNNVTQSTQKFRAGAAYDLFAPSSQEYFLSNTNKWNSVRIVAKGDSVEHWMNGVKVAGFKYWSPTFLSAYQNSKWTGFNRYCQTAPNNRTYIPEGYIGLQGDHGGAWQIRRMRILHDSLPPHDSLPKPDRVKFGPVDTSTTSIFPSRSMERQALKLETRAGRLHVSSGGEALKSVDLFGFDGRLVRREALNNAGTSHAIDVSTVPHGLYFVRAETRSGQVRNARTLIH